MASSWKKAKHHSRGAWEAIGHRICAEGEGFAPLALIQEQPRCAEMVANASLISAAPDLLAAIEDAIPIVKELWQQVSDEQAEMIWSQLERMHAAYAKATRGQR